jgi:hypothetical protein
VMMCERSASDRWGCWVLGSKADEDVGDCWCGSVCDVCGEQRRGDGSQREVHGKVHLIPSPGTMK